MGWTLICTTQVGDINIVRAQFRDIYRTILRREQIDLENRSLLDALPAGKKGDIVRKALAGKTL